MMTAGFVELREQPLVRRRKYDKKSTNREMFRRTFKLFGIVADVLQHVDGDHEVVMRLVDLATPLGGLYERWVSPIVGA